MILPSDDSNLKIVLKNLKTYPVTVLLVDDQPIIAEAVRTMLAGEENIAFHYCDDPEKAIQMAHEVHPTVVLQDLVMPDIDGLTLLRYFQANPETRDVPIIILSTKEDPVIKANSFALGAADYIVKLPDKIEMLARIRHHSEAYIHLLERNDAYQKLAENQATLNADLHNAATYVTSLLPLPLHGDIEANWRFIPSTQLGGDIFGYHWLDADHFALYLLDVCGHGVGAALLSITIANVIQTQTLPNIDFKDPSHVLYSLNGMFPMEKHNGMFFTIWYGVYNKKTRLLKYSSAGHPPALLYNLEGANASNPLKLQTEGLVIGAIENVTFTNDYCQVPFNNRLFLYSDGVYELKNSKEERIEYTEFLHMLDRYAIADQHDLDEIVYADQHIQGGKLLFEDDFSIVEFTFH
jgi:phosphoserine phosphatase RsbU/P